MRLAALNHSLWKLLAAQYSIGIIGTARLGKSTLVAELSGQNTAAGEGKSCHTHTVHTYENKDALGINIMDFPGVDDLGALEGLFARGSSAVDMLVILADGPKAHVREMVNLLKAVAEERHDQASRPLVHAPRR
ncbi:hypothetical protein EMIHUDRAFT_228684 [Emiliania huxleyi CCMP1516]|uniref:G domain-containing protein n=2 Tax=Emiliania huxleyi TaxID=2903 RepID=A0A0D3KFF4_EMIH1|nr:hypothetical protein EMIHUDRAFT_228684 [Emiliania huxleyi CCMP1516]EOD34489.1 hypothetical protein EMIHUDRAFT_228684 [Emiliania huxleyi CCMP1516]|eukprot:XP_005786918.1 hypothetical protein EMIHUDRAFT_228684 [Emiliania huxleyi CCMP1516]